MIKKCLIAALGLAAASVSVPANAQDESNVIVTASRSDRSGSDYYDEEQSAIGLTRSADYSAPATASRFAASIPSFPGSRRARPTCSFTTSTTS